MASTEQRLFAPGDGAAPPELAGRSTQQAVLSRCLADLVGGSAPPHNVVLVGPRGNGKTVLLNWFKTACVDAPSVEVLALTPRDIPTPPALVGALLPRRGLTKLMSRLPRKVGIASVGSVEWTPTDGSGWRNLAEELAARCRRKPLVFLLDEAHTLEPNVGSALLNASQQVRAEAPLLLVLAGTPGLPAHLNAMDTSFWGRLGEGLLGVGRLSDAAARAALSKPLTRHDVEIDADALDAVIEDSQHYPYFIQLWGDALWQWHLANAGARLTTAATAAVQDAVAARVANYYEGRYQELAAGGLLSAATAVAPLFQGAMDATASNQEVDNALLAAALEDSAERFAASEGLNRLSYMWRPPGQLPPVLWSIGIPSLTTYVLEHAPASAIGGVPTREKTPKSDNKELDERRGIGPQSTGDDVFQRRMRRHQSWYRDKVLKVPYGTGPTKSRTSL